MTGKEYYKKKSKILNRFVMDIYNLKNGAKHIIGVNQIDKCFEDLDKELELLYKEEQENVD